MTGGVSVATTSVSSKEVPLTQMIYKDELYIFSIYQIIPASTLIANLNLNNIVLGPFPSPGPVIMACVEVGKLNSNECWSYVITEYNNK